jgi:hypothetical protein
MRKLIATTILVSCGLAGSTLGQSSLTSYDREAGREMLKIIRLDIEKYYYDPSFRGIDLKERFGQADGRIKNAKSNGPATDISNKNGNRTLQQWMSNSFKLTGDRNPSRLVWGGEPTRPDGPSSRYRMVENESFVYSDFPGLRKNTENAGNLT